MVWKVLLIILIVLVVVLAVLYFLGKRAQKKQEAQQEQIEAAKQSVSMLVIDKKRLPIKQSGLPQMVIDQTPKLMRRSKLPIVKAKIGPGSLPWWRTSRSLRSSVKKEVKAEVSGIYITGVRGLRGALEAPQKKKGSSRECASKRKTLPRETKQRVRIRKRKSKKLPPGKRNPDGFFMMPGGNCLRPGASHLHKSGSPLYVYR